MHDYFFANDRSGLHHGELARFVLISPLLSVILDEHGSSVANAAAITSALPAASERCFDQGYPRPLRVSLPAARALARRLLDQVSIEWLRENLPTWWELFREVGAPMTVTLRGGPPGLDRRALAGLVAEQQGVTSVVFDMRQPAAGRWEWPLRIGIPGDVLGQQLYAQLLSAHYRELYEIELLGQHDAVVDLLLLPGALFEAAAAVPHRRTVADAVLVLGRDTLAPRRAAVDLRVLVDRYRSGLVGVCDVPPDCVTPWFQVLMRELSHNRGLPDALFLARRSSEWASETGVASSFDAPAPLLFGDASFIASTRLEDAALRLAENLKRQSPGTPALLPADLLARLGLDPATATATELGAGLEHQLRNMRWMSETGDATTVVRLRRELENQLGRLDTEVMSPSRSSMDPRDGWAMSAPPPEMAGPMDDMPEAFAEAPAPDRGETRHVQARVLPLGLAPGSEPDQPVVLVADTAYRLLVHVGIDRGGPFIVASEPLDESSLPASTNGHLLKIVYCPLSPAVDDAGHRSIPAPMQDILMLPAAGDSAAVEFVLRCGQSPRDFRARVIVAHENRVLQTLLFTMGEEGVLVLHPENQFSPTLASPSADAPADLAFVVNDNPDGASGVTTMQPGAVSFLEPEGLKESIRRMRIALSTAVATDVGDTVTISSDANLKMMIMLANHGAMILQEISRHHPMAGLDGARRVQVVEAVDKAYFPVEFLYTGKAPMLDAKVCPKAVAALEDPVQTVHEACSHRNDPDFVCPAAFWGFQKCIERLASTGDQTHQLSVPEAGENRLGPFSSALIAASNRAKDEMKGPRSLPKVVASHVAKVSRVDSWKDWKAKVDKDKPDLLVLMPHSEESRQLPGIPILEVSLNELHASHLDEAYVRAEGAGGKGPLLLLMGCSTTFAETPFLNFVRRFNLSGAPIVIGTLSIIHGTQASMVTQQLLAAIAKPGHEVQRFDEAILGVKRRLAAAGHSVAFSLIAYGHSSWRL